MRMQQASNRRMIILLPLLALAACAGSEGAAPGEGGSSARAAEPEAAALTREMERIEARAREVEDRFRPLPLQRPAQEEALRRFGNPQQMVAARRLGIRPGTSEGELERLVSEGTLVRLADTTDLWVVRELEHSTPYVVPDVEVFLRELATRFQAALARLDIPPYRLEVSSVLRSAEDQERLRRVNPNAAAGESTHQFGTTFDVLYSAYAPPAAPLVEPRIPEAPWLEPQLRWAAATRAEALAARYSRELQEILGRVLLEMQGEGKVMVTLERLQPVYHMTIARRLTE
jgi:hypothetical protein